MLNRFLRRKPAVQFSKRVLIRITPNGLRIHKEADAGCEVYVTDDRRPGVVARITDTTESAIIDDLLMPKMKLIEGVAA
jgi:glycine cleavage system regulatory protein